VAWRRQRHLRWGPTHVVGHSLGGMVATRLAVLAPERVASLTLVCATAGGWQSLPCSWRVAKYGLQARGCLCASWHLFSAARHPRLGGSCAVRAARARALCWACGS